MERGAAEFRSTRKKQFEKQFSEFPTKYHINNEIYRRVDCHGKIGNLYLHSASYTPESFKKSFHHWYQIAQQENNDNAQQHSCQSDFLFLVFRQILAFLIRPPHLQIKQSAIIIKPYNICQLGRIGEKYSRRSISIF